MRRQDVLVILLHFFGCSSIRTLLFRLRGKPITRFVCFHDIGPGSEDLFRRKMGFLQRHMNVVSLDDYFAGRLSSVKINSVITFDDGYKSWRNVAMPVLQEFDLPATFFVSSGFVGLSPAEEANFVSTKLRISQPTSGGLDQADLRVLADEGFTIGGHTRNHVDLGELREATVVERELVSDKQELEDITGRRVDYFAYPFGHCKNACMNIPAAVERAGYKAAVTVKPGFNRRDPACPYLLHRELTDAAMATVIFKARVYGNYDVVALVRGPGSSAQPY
jgi:peptidoglycan/xylan/chitin deacetylase (PgdA/CDA1 family)